MVGEWSAVPTDTSHSLSLSRSGRYTHLLLRCLLRILGADLSSRLNLTQLCTRQTERHQMETTTEVRQRVRRVCAAWTTTESPTCVCVRACACAWVRVCVGACVRGCVVVASHACKHPAGEESASIQRERRVHMEGSACGGAASRTRSVSRSISPCLRASISRADALIFIFSSCSVLFSSSAFVRSRLRVSSDLFSSARLCPSSSSSRFCAEAAWGGASRVHTT
jgi:hypothetical protein